MADAGPLETVQAINLAWQAGDTEALASAFHPAAVIVQPGFKDRVEGREACVASYLDFTRQARVERLEEFDAQVDVTGSTAVVTYGFRLTYDLDGQRHADRGTDVYVLGASDEGGWQVVWRTLVVI